MSRVTLADVAKKSGLSRATIDRVINKRGNVKASTIEAVLQTLRDCGYLLDSEKLSNSHQQAYCFDFILPKTRTSYFEYFEAEIKRLSTTFAKLKTQVRIHLIEGLNPELLANKLKDVSKNSDGIAFVALDHPKVRLVVNALHQKLALVSLVSDITSTNRLAYVGIDNRSAGRTAGLLMGKYLGPRNSGRIALFAGSHAYRGHEERLAGFKSYIKERYSNLIITEYPEVHDDDQESYAISHAALKSTADLVGIYNVGGGTPGIVKSLKTLNKAEDIVLIAHELNEITKSYLVEGVVDVILNQNIRHELFSAVDILLSANTDTLDLQNFQQPAVEVYVAENIY